MGDPANKNLIPPLLALARYFGGAKKYAEAAPYYFRIISIEEIHSGTKSAKLIEPLGGLANTLNCLGKLKLAENVYRRGLALAKKHLSEKNDWKLFFLGNLASILEVTNRESAANEIKKQMKRILSKKR